MGGGRRRRRSTHPNIPYEDLFGNLFFCLQIVDIVVPSPAAWIRSGRSYLHVQKSIRHALAKYTTQIYSGHFVSFQSCEVAGVCQVEWASPQHRPWVWQANRLQPRGSGCTGRAWSRILRNIACTCWKLPWGRKRDERKSWTWRLVSAQASHELAPWVFLTDLKSFIYLFIYLL